MTTRFKPASVGLHGIASTATHSSDITPEQILKADANGLPAEGTNTDTEVADVVSNHKKRAIKWSFILGG